MIDWIDSEMNKIPSNLLRIGDLCNDRLDRLASRINQLINTK